MKSATKKIKWLLPLLLIGGMFTACQDRGEEPQSQEQMQEEQSIAPANLDMDVVDQVYDGEVAVLGSSSADFMPYFLKRFPNVAGSITENSDVVILDETAAQGVLGNASLLETLQLHWAKNKAIGFVNPSSNAIKLLSKLNDADDAGLDEESKALMENYAFYLVKKDGNAMSYCKSNVSNIEIEYVDSLTNEIKVEKVMPTNELSSEYSLGRIGERAAEWMNSFNGAKLRSLDASCGDVAYQAFTNKIYQTVTVDHDYLVNYNDFGTGPGPRTTEAIIELKVYAGFDVATNKYVYDVNVSEVFDASKCYIENIVTQKKMAYKYKYTGGNYAGLNVGLRLTNVAGSDISYTQATPIGMASSSTQTYYPSTLTVGGGLAAGADASGPSFSGNLCFSYTPAYTTIAMTDSELPVQYQDNHTWVEWDYGKKLENYNQVYDIEWGFNPTFKGVAQFSTRSCLTEQAITYMLDASTDKYDGKSVCMGVNATFKTFHESAGPWGGTHCFMYQYANMYVYLPVVPRYFDRYTPYCKAMHVVDKTEKWEDVENTLRSNVNYKVFYNENLLIGSPVKDGLNKEAGEVWESTIQSIIKQFSARNFNNEYVVGLANSKGESLKMGLYIKGNTWKLVDDINQVQLGVE